MKKAHKIYTALILIFMYAPILILMVLSFNASKSRAKWGGFTLKWYRELFENEEMLNALYTTILIALIASVVAVIVGVIASLVIHYMSNRKRRIIMGITNIPMLNADIVTGISLMIFFVVCRFTLGFVSVLIAHVTFSIPYVILSVLPRLSRMETSQIEAARDLGATPKQAFVKILIPELYPGILSGFLLSFTMSIDDFIITHFCKGPGINTLSTEIYTELRRGIKPGMYVLSTLLFLMVMVFMILGRKTQSTGKHRIKASRAAWFIRTRLFPILVIAAMVFCSVKVYRINHSANDNRLIVYNWGEYIDPKVIDMFEEETGIDVVYEEFDSNETMYAKVKNGSIDYDLLCPSDYMIERMINEGMLEKLDFDKIPNASNVGKIFYEKSRSFDNENEYAIPYLWGTLGILYNEKLVDENVDSWKILFDPKYSNDILMMDSVRDSLAVPLGYMGFSINSKDMDELHDAKEMLVSQKPLISGYLNDQMKDKMIGEEDKVALAFSGDAVEAMRENESLKYVVPKENGNMWIDAFVMTANSKHKDNAYMFLNFLCREDIALMNFRFTGYSSPVNNIDTQLDEEDEVFHDVIFPSEQTLSHLEVYCDLGDEWTNRYSEAFREVKSK